MALTSDMHTDPEGQTSFPTECCISVSVLAPITVIQLVLSQEGWNPVNLCVHLTALFLPRADRMVPPGVFAFRVTSFLVDFHNRKCPYHLWSATLLVSHADTFPRTKQVAQLLFSLMETMVVRYWFAKGEWVLLLSRFVWSVVSDSTVTWINGPTLTQMLQTLIVWDYDWWPHLRLIVNTLLGGAKQNSVCLNWW